MGSLILRIIFSLNGGSGTTPSTISRSFSTTTSVTMPSAPTPPTGKHFTHWSVPAGTYYTRSSPMPAAGATVNFSNRYTGSGNVSANCEVTAQYSYNTYTVAYNANGGSGAPANQTKTYGTNLTLSTTKPTRTGYTFLGWNTNSSGTGTNYASGGTYTANAAVTLYARWQINTWTVSYNANSGSGAPASQTKTYGQTLVLSSTVPTKYAYKFIGWATSSGGTPTYQPGGNYTANEGATLYAIWQQSYFEPTITNLSAVRARAEGSSYVDDEENGTYAHIKFNWATGTNDGTTVTPASCTVRITNQSTETYTDTTITLTANEVDTYILTPVLSESAAYTVKVTFTITGWNDVTSTTSIPAAYFIMDINPDGTAIGFGGVVDDSDSGVILFMPLKIYIDDSAASGTTDYIIKTSLEDLDWDDDCLE